MKKVLLVMVSLLLISRVNAKTLSIEELIEGFMETSTIKDMNTSDNGGKITVVNDEENKTITVKLTSDESTESEERVYSYANGYFEFTDDRQITEANVVDNLNDSIYLYSFFEGALTKSGLDIKKLDGKLENFKYDFNRHGIYIEEEPFEIKETEEGYSSTFKGSFIRAFKLSFDTSKLETFANDVLSTGGSSTTQNGIPTLKYKNRKKTSVELNVYVEGATSTTTCDVYRSTDNVDYEKITALSGPCNDKNKYVTDTGLKETSLYYYKAVINGSNEYSPVLKVTEYDENPDTGVNNIIPILIGLVISITLLFIFRKNSINQLQ